MYSKHKLKRYSLSVIALLMCLVAYTVILASSQGHGEPKKNPQEAGVRERIAILMSNTLKEREKITPEGTKLWLPVPPPQEAFREVKGYGDKAVLILAEYLKSGAYHERELAMQFLVHIGGSRIVESLLMVIRYDPEPRLREGALAYLEQIPWEEAAPILKEASTVDPDPRVREKADYILMSHEARESKPQSEGFIRKRIAILMTHIIKEGELVTSDGVKVQTKAYPSNEELEEIKHYGDAAVPILSEYLTREESREKSLAMRFLSMLGGSRIVEPLRKVALYDSSPAMRESALRMLGTAPREMTYPIIKEAAENDPDSQVRKTAKDILESSAKKK